MLQFGHGGRIDLEEAVRLYRRGCQGRSCSGLARMLRDGVGVQAACVGAGDPPAQAGEVARHHTIADAAGERL